MDPILAATDELDHSAGVTLTWTRPVYGYDHGYYQVSLFRGNEELAVAGFCDCEFDPERPEPYAAAEREALDAAGLTPEDVTSRVEPW